MVATSILSTLLLAFAVDAKPIERRASLVDLSFIKIVSGGNLYELDHLRAKLFKGLGIPGFFGPGIASSPADNRAVSYIATVGVGSPPTNYDLIIDSGSSNTWLGSTHPYVQTSTSHQTPNSVDVTYGTGHFSGTEFIDQISISPELVIRKQSIGVASTSEGFETVDGILGIGPTGLTVGTLSPDTTASIPTVTDNLKTDGKIFQRVIGISFEPLDNPTSSGTQMNGKLTWGGVDFFKFLGPITYAPITSTSPSNEFWGIDALMTYGNTPILSKTAGIVDTGTTLILIATDAFHRYQEVTGGVPDAVTTLLKITPNQFANLKSFFVYVENVPFELIPNAQIWPRRLNTLIGGTEESIYLIVNDAGEPSGSGLDFLLGQTFLERFYSVYDTEKSRVGLARTKFTDAETN